MSYLQEMVEKRIKEGKFSEITCDKCYGHICFTQDTKFAHRNDKTDEPEKVTLCDKCFNDYYL